MINFSVIAIELQIIIAEQMYYTDQKEFALASKKAKEIHNLTRRKAVVETSKIVVARTGFDLWFVFSVGNNQKVISWLKLRQFADLPRLLLRKLEIENVSHLDWLTEISDKITFVNNKMCLYLKNRLEDIIPALDVISKINRIGMFESRGSLDPAVLNHSALDELDTVDIWVDLISDDRLLQLSSPCLILREPTDSFRVQSVANRFFKQWFFEDRKIERFFILGTRSTDLELLFLRRLPYSVICKNIDSSTPKTFSMLKETERKEPYYLYKGDGLYSIDKGNKKLLVFHSCRYEIIRAQEYTNLYDVIVIHR